MRLLPKFFACWSYFLRTFHWLEVKRYSQRTQMAGCCLDTDTRSWQSLVSSNERHRWGRPCTHPCWTPDSFPEAPRKNWKEKKKKSVFKKMSYNWQNLVFTPLPVAGELGISVGVVPQGGCHATEPSRHAVPLVEAYTAAEGVASSCALGALLGRHLQELPGFAREGWRTRWRKSQGWNWGSTAHLTSRFLPFSSHFAVIKENVTD